MRINEINGVNEGILDTARRGVRKLRNRFANQQVAPQDTPPQVEPTMGTPSTPKRGFMTGLATGLGAPDLANTIAQANASRVKPVQSTVAPAVEPTKQPTQGNFPFPSAVPAADASMPNVPPPVNEPEPEDEVDTTNAGANAFGQMSKQLNVMPKTSTGGTLANTPTGVTHTASPNNPNQPPATRYAQKNQKRGKMRESTDIAETLWRKMKSKR